MGSKEINKGFKEEMAKIGKSLKDFFKPFNKLLGDADEHFSNTEIEFDDSIDKLLNFEGQPKLKAKERKELEKDLRERATKHLRNNYPELVKQFEEKILLMDGMAQYLDKIRDRLNDFENEIDEIESMADDLENRKENISW